MELHNMEVNRFDIEGPVEVISSRHIDERGYFCEAYNSESFAATGIPETQWVQDNQSFSKSSYTLRGLHFQLPPVAQAKLVRVLRGSIWDVAVDIRRSSSSFGKWIAITLSAERFNQLYIPAGFAHGFLTLEPDVEVLYKVSSPYSKQHDRAIRWDDAELGISWPLAEGIRPLLSEKDANAPGFSMVVAQFSSLREVS
jgi:dTDP-4-dehydrorhamnose 3,5-epimerase